MTKENIYHYSCDDCEKEWWQAAQEVVFCPLCQCDRVEGKVSSYSEFVKEREESEHKESRGAFLEYNAQRAREHDRRCSYNGLAAIKDAAICVGTISSVCGDTLGIDEKAMMSYREGADLINSIVKLFAPS